MTTPRAAALQPGAVPARRAVLGVLVGATVASSYLWHTDPHQPGHLLPVCPFRVLTGWLCPVCGATRMTYDVMHGDLAHAWRDNALLLLLVPVLLWLLVRWCVAGLRGRSHRLTLPRWGGPVVLGVGLGWAILRNAVVAM